jgi:hypothetical protein
MHPALLIVGLAAALAAPTARADDRPSEDELFGAKPATPPQAAPAQPAPGGKAGAQPRSKTDEAEAELFGSKGSPNAQPPPPEGFISREREDWLKTGGQLYLRLQGTASEDTKPKDWPISSPNLLDVYLDSRPNDRVRGFVLGRMFYDPTLSSGQTVSSAVAGASGTGVPVSGLQGGTTANPAGFLDQLWINFDVGHRAFVTAGRQHVKWGVGKFWNPTDYLHPVKRNPLAVFDARTGTTMVKVHVPWEKRGWNLYGVALLEDAAGNPNLPVNTVGRVGAGGRAELVLGPAELGLDALVQEGHHARYGVDLSSGLGPLDVYAEAALRHGGDGSHWVQGGPTHPCNPPNPCVPPSLDGWQAVPTTGLTPQIVVGASFAANYSDEDAVTVGAEYFYNDLGYSDPAVYPFLLLGAPAVSPTGALVAQDPTSFQPFYLGKHYAGVYVSLPKPGSWNDTTFTLSVLGNLSDRTYIARLDHSVLVLTYLTIETYLAGHFGPKGGEFRFALPSDVATLFPSTGSGAYVPLGAPVVDAGIALRMSL